MELLKDIIMVIIGVCIVFIVASLCIGIIVIGVLLIISGKIISGYLVLIGLLTILVAIMIYNKEG